MAGGHVVATIDFGAFPGANEASVVVTGQAGISATSKVECYVMAGDVTADHTAIDHRYLPRLASFICGAIVPTVGYTIYAVSEHKLQGTFSLRSVWSD